MLSFIDWNWKLIEARVLEMAEVFRLMPPVRGPREYGSNMPEPVRRYDESYGYAAARYRKVPSAGAISRCDETFDWMIRYLSASERSDLQRWCTAKLTKGAKLKDIAEKNCIHERTYRRQIQFYCQKIADGLNRAVHPRLTTGGFQLSENLIHEQPDTLHKCVDGNEHQTAPEKRKPFWQAPGAKPQIDPDAPMVRLLKPRKPKRGRGKKKPRRSGAVA